MSRKKEDIILFGTPRSGSSWLSEVLTYQGQLQLQHEPDNELNNYWGLYHKIGLGRYPFLKEGDSNTRYLKLFEEALKRDIAKQNDWPNKLIKKLNGLSIQKLQKNLDQSGIALAQDIPLANLWITLLKSGESNSPFLVKTVHALLALPFLKENLSFKGIILHRHPLNSFSSHVKMKMPDANRKLYLNKALLRHFEVPGLEGGPEELSHSYLCGYQAGLFARVIENYKKRFTDILYLEYEDLISAPFERIPALFETLGLDYTNSLENWMKDRFTKGEGYTTKRDISQQSAIWKQRLNEEEATDFLNGYEKSFGSISFVH